MLASCYLGEAFYYIRCAEVSSSGSNLVFYVALIAVVIIVVGGSLFAVKFLREFLAKVSYIHGFSLSICWCAVHQDPIP